MRTSTERDNNCAREGYAYSDRTAILCDSRNNVIQHSRAVTRSVYYIIIVGMSRLLDPRTVPFTQMRIITRISPDPYIYHIII